MGAADSVIAMVPVVAAVGVLNMTAKSTLGSGIHKKTRHTVRRHSRRR